MKKITLQILLLFLIVSCSKPSQCIESTGAIITKTVNLSGFKKIRVYKGIYLVITQGAVQKVEIKTGENLMSNIEVSVADSTLIAKDNTTCNWVREFGQTTVYVTTPKLTDIISKTDRNITSNGILTFPNLRIEAMDLSDGAGTGDFYLQINNTDFTIDSNNFSNFYISGQTTNFFPNFYEGNGRIEAQNLAAQNIKLFHRGSNDMILNPILKIEGDLYSTGNVICKNHPPTVAVTPHYHGQLIFN